jgi:transcriptional regulator with XRE-family HTH domain
MTFGERVRELRKEQRVSQRDLAGRAGIDFTYLSKIENGRAEPPSEDAIRRIAEELDTNADSLILLADKFPSDIEQWLKTPERVAVLRRSLSGDVNSTEDWRNAFG